MILGLWSVDRLLMAWKWLLLLRALSVPVPLSIVIRLYYQGSFTGTFLPSSLGGDLLRGVWVSRATGAAPQVYASILMERLIGFVSAISWAFIGGTIIVSVMLTEAAFRLGLMAVLGAPVVMAFLLMSLRPFRFMQQSVSGGRRSQIAEFFCQLSHACSQYGNQPRVLIWNWLLALVEHGLQMVIVFAMALSLGISADILLFLSVTAVYLLIYRLPISVDGWGIGELSAVGLFGIIGVSSENGFALAFLSHVLQIIVVLPGLWFLWRFGPVNRLTS
jgi:uncharacterized protein (TIRG00374 family)